MAVSKRLRFEILRRDNHACRYCGQVSPEVILTVDHVVPVALGGSDKPENLVAACKDCNSGKSATPMGAPLTEDVAQDAIRWSTAMQAAFARAVAAIGVRDAYVDEFLEAWNNWTYNGAGKTVPLPSDWQGSVTKWYALGLPIEILVDAVGTAMRKRNLNGSDGEFRYMAGVVWGTLTEIQHQTAALMSAPHSALSHDDTHCPWGCGVHPDPEDGNEPDVCAKCGQLGCLWACGRSDGMQDGYSVGYDAAWERLREMHGFAIGRHRHLSDAVEGRVIDEFLASLPDAAAPF